MQTCYEIGIPQYFFKSSQSVTKIQQMAIMNLGTLLQIKPDLDVEQTSFGSF